MNMQSNKSIKKPVSIKAKYYVFERMLTFIITVLLFY